MSNGYYFKIVRKYNLLLLEDGSHAHNSSILHKKIGTFGDASAFSIQGQKTLTGGEGGFVLTNNDEIYYRCLLLGHYNKRCKKEIPKDHRYAKYATTGMGLKLRAHPLALAIALDQLKKLNIIVDNRKKVAEYIYNNLKNISGINILMPRIGESTSWYAMIIKFQKELIKKITIQKFVTLIREKGHDFVDIPDSTCPLNHLALFQNPGELFPKYQNKFSYYVGQFPKAGEFFFSIFKIPIWDNLEDNRNKIDRFIANTKELLEL